MPLTQSQLVDVQNIVNETTKTIFGEEFIRNLTRTITEAVQQEIETKYKKVFTKLENEIITLKAENDKLRYANDKLEQYSRRNNICIFGVAECEDPNIEKTVLELFNDKLHVKITPDAIDRCHRLGSTKKPNSGPRPIIVKFTSNKYKQLVFNNKRKLKGLRVVVKEDLTSSRLLVMNEARKTLQADNIWTRDGKICVMVKNKIHTLTTLQDVTNLKEKI